MRNVVAVENSEIFIGRQGENNATTVQFQVDGWREQYGNGTFELLHKRRTDTLAYPCAVSETDTTVEWVIGNADVAIAGKGEAQLIYVVNGNIAKSVIFITCTAKSLENGETPPDPFQSWIDEVVAAGASAEYYAGQAAESKSDSEAYALGTRNGVPVSRGDPAYNKNSKYYQLEAFGYKSQAYNAYWMANNKADEAAASATESSASATKSEGYAVGKSNGTDVQPTSPYYHNNAKYYAELAEQRAEEAGYVLFDINDDDGCLYVTTAGHIGEDVTFELNEETGMLEVIYT